VRVGCFGREGRGVHSIRGQVREVAMLLRRGGFLGGDGGVVLFCFVKRWDVVRGGGGRNMWVCYLL